MEPKAPHANCSECPLKENKCVPTTGPKDAKIAFVSRSPGKHDVRAGKPFGGPSGKVLDHLLGRYGVSRDNIITTNVVLCTTDDPPLAAIKACKPRLEYEIANCDVVIAGGVEATSSLTKYRSISSGRGFLTTRVAPVSNKSQSVVVTNNPAMVIRDSDSYPNMVQDFKRALDPPPPPVFPEVRVINDPSDSRKIVAGWLDREFDLITTDLEWVRDTSTIVCAGFSTKPGSAMVIGREAISDKRTFELLKRFYEREDISFGWHNGKSDTTVLRRNDILGRVDEDTLLQSYALDERPGYHDLEYLLSSNLGWPDYEPTSVKAFKKTGQLTKPYELYKYNGWDCAGTMQLFDIQTPQLHEDGVYECYQRLLKAANAMRSVEMRGFRFDAEEACNLREREVLPRLWKIEEELRAISQHPLLNPSSAPQMAAIYYGDFGLKHGLRDTGKKKLSHSTGKEVREEIAGDRFTCKPKHKEQLIVFAATHQRQRKLDTLRGTFIEGLAKRVAAGEERIHTHFNEAGTATGRLSSKDPNLQNVVREGIDDIPGMRSLFLASEGNVIVSADFSQAELRTCAKLSGDSNLLAIYRDSSRSLHKERAAAFYGEAYTKEEYVKSKNINFGVTYGQSAKAFAQMYHMPEREAQDYINSWWTEFSALKAWTQETQKRALKEGFIQSPFGHKRRFHLITDENIGDIRREAVNFLPQNIAAWLTVSSIIQFETLGIPVVATVHDSIVADVPESESLEIAATMKTVMEKQAIEQLGWIPDDIPFLVDISIGPTWGEMEDYDVVPMMEAA